MVRIVLDDFSYDYGTVVSTPSVSEGGRSFSLDNRSALLVKRWAIDKVVFKNSTEQRCDFLLFFETSKEEANIFYWIELKGKDVIKACRQIINTLNLIGVEANAKHEARIITTGTNKLDIRSADYLRLDIRKRKMNGILKTYTNQGHEII